MFDSAIKNLEDKLLGIAATRANPRLLSTVKVLLEGKYYALSSVADILSRDNQLVIEPREKKISKKIVKAIEVAQLGLDAYVDSHTVKINIPSLTEERKEDLRKKIKELGEQAKISVRNSRTKLLKSHNKNYVQERVDSANKQIDEIVRLKLGTLE
jgi:ribosome recycling factor